MARVGQQDSIAQSIHLLLVTAFGEYRYSKDFGFLIWDLQFDTLPETGVWIKKMGERFREAIENFEMRLTDVKVQIDLDQVEQRYENFSTNKQMKRLLKVNISGNLIATKEPFFFKETLTISPFNPT